MEREHVETVLQDMEVKPWPGVYVLGCLDRRVTVYSQQVRALNLAAALLAGKKVKPGDEVVVVGAGAAGLTCAAGLQHLGAKVTVLEKDKEILSTFRGASQRWLHPGVYDWPMEGWSLEDTGLPLLGWKHGLVSKVREDLTTKWAAIGIKVVPEAKDVRLGNPKDEPHTVTWNPGGKRKRECTVILAVGFGLEAYGSYWDGDDIEPKSEDKLRTWLVSGCGDGALTDLLRLCIKGFQHHEMLPRFTQDPRMCEIKEEIQRIESTASLVGNPPALHDAYAALDAPWVRAAMERRTDTKVWLNAPADFLTNGASPLNRFLVAQLHRDERFDLLPGRLLKPENDREWRTVARFEDGPKDFDCIVRRHGPTPALKLGFDLIDKALADERQRRKDKPTLTDQTRQRWWPQGLFGEETRASELARYHAELERRHGSIHLAGFEARVRVPVPLDDLHVPLNAVVKGSGANEANLNEAAAAAPDREISLTTAFEVAAAASQRGVVVLGPPGSGKSTHLQQVLLTALRERERLAGLPDGMLPVLLPLRRLAKHHASLQAFVEEQLDTGGFDTGPRFGARMWASGKLLLLLDGLDEVADADERRKLAGWIRAACEERAEDRFVVTCRFAGYPKDASLGARFLALELRPMTDGQVKAFVGRWYDAVERATGGDAAQARARARTLFEVLRKEGSDARFHAMSTKPLLLSLMCLMHRDRGELPRKRVLLYEEVVTVLLEQWRRVFKDLPVTFNAREARLVLQPVAEHMHRQQEHQSEPSPERRCTPIAEVEPLLHKGLELIERTDVTARQFVQAIRDESGLLTGAGVDELAFMHLGFQEFLTARSLRARAFDEPEVLAELAGRFEESWWQEVILLLLADGDPPMFRRFMSEVAKRPELPRWVDHAMMDRCWNEAFAPTTEPFVALLKERDSTGDEVRTRQEAAEKLLRKKRPEALAPLEARATVPTRRTKPETTTVEGVELVLVPAGWFMMGSPKNDPLGFDDEHPQQRVVLEKAFWLARTPVTNGEYAAYLKANPKARKPEYWGDERYNQPQQPVVGVSWKDAKKYCAWAGFRLPAEAQWEYACRAGTKTQYSSGNSVEDLARVGWYRGNSGDRLHVAGELETNDFGLCDMHGNVWEWCEDTWVDNYEGAVRIPDNGLRVEPVDDVDRVIRGGSFKDVARYARSAYRDAYAPGNRWSYVGFRPARDHP
jgi:formylglycine-generating enzyme required for sulfatase activity